MLSRLRDAILTFLFPPSCLACDRWGTYVCLPCVKRVEPVFIDSCLQCKRKVDNESFICQRCPQQHQSVQGVLSVNFYNDTMKRIVHELKYRKVSHAFATVGAVSHLESVAKYVAFTRAYPQAVLVPVPLHLRRFHERGFNQASYLARFFSYITELPVREDLVIRWKNTKPLASCKTALERHTEIRDAFRVVNPEAVKDQMVVLVDDVVTSGATVRSLGQTLKTAGAKEVFVFSLARGE